MANLLARSPIYIAVSHPINADRAELDITIVGDTETKTYTFNKPCVDNKAVFEVSDIVRELINNKMETYYSYGMANAIVSYATQTFYQGVARTPSTGSFVAYEGYNDKFNPYQRVNEEIERGVLQSNETIYAPENVPLWVTLMTNIGISISTISASYEGTISFNDGQPIGQVTIVRDCSMYDPLQIAFVNKFGFKQQIFINRKSVKSINVSSDGYKSGMFGVDGLTNTDRPIHRYNVNGRETIVGSTGYVNDEYAEVIKQLLLSEQVWLSDVTNGSGINLPVNVKTSGVTYMNSLNDKLCNYTLEFEMAFNAINDIR